MKKKPIKIILAILILFVLGYIVLSLLFPNKAQKQSKFITQYAKQQNLIQFRTAGDAGQGPDNQTPWYEIYYKTSESPNSLKTNLETMLRAQGYTVRDNFFNPKPCLDTTGDLVSGPAGCPIDSSTSGSANNGGMPYWVINASGPINSVGAEITNVSYFDTSYTHNLYKNILGQHPVPPGFTVLNITLSVN